MVAQPMADGREEASISISLLNSVKADYVDVFAWECFEHCDMVQQDRHIGGLLLRHEAAQTYPSQFLGRLLGPPRRCRHRRSKKTFVARQHMPTSVADDRLSR